MGSSYESKIFNNMWCITCCPNSNKGNVILCLQLICLPANIAKLKVKYTLCCHEANIKSTNIKIFEYEQGKSYGLWTASKLLSFEQFKLYNNIILSAEIEILDEIHCDSCKNTENEVEQFWNEYIKQKTYFHQITDYKTYPFNSFYFDYKYYNLDKKINKLQNGMETIMDNISELTQTMKSLIINQRMHLHQNQNQNQNGRHSHFHGHKNWNVSHEDNQMYLWLKNTVGLECYFNQFIKMESMIWIY